MAINTHATQTDVTDMVRDHTGCDKLIPTNYKHELFQKPEDKNLPCSQPLQRPQKEKRGRAIGARHIDPVSATAIAHVAGMSRLG
jgi:hypothetical protein